jgi:hypothetical protein
MITPNTTIDAVRNGRIHVFIMAMGSSSSPRSWRLAALRMISLLRKVRLAGQF